MAFDNIKIRNLKNTLFKGLVIALALVCTVPLIFILFYIFKKGISAISWNFITNLPKPVGETGGGIANAISGSLLLITTSLVIALPPGIIVGIYLSENKGIKFVSVVRTAVEVLQGIPSIVVGIVIYFWVVKTMRGFSALSGSVALALMMLPIIIRSTEETLLLLPSTLKEGAMALGASYYKTISKVLIPCGMSGIISAVLLSVARVAGETAPLLFTAFGSPYMNNNILKPMQSLPLSIFTYSTSPYEEWHQLAWGASFMLVSIILILNITTKIATRKWKVQF